MGNHIESDKSVLYKRVLFSTAFIIGLIVLISGSLSFAVAADSTNVDPNIQDKFADNDTNVEVLVRLDDISGQQFTINDKKTSALSSQSAVKEFAQQNGAVELKNQFWVVNMVLIEVNADKVSTNEILSLQGVEKLYANEVHNVEQTEDSSAAATSGVEQINVTEVWEKYDTKGDGVKIAVLDTGVHIDHPDLTLRSDDASDSTYPGGWAEFDENGDRVQGSEPSDLHGHGSHVHGIATGGNSSGEYIGVAPNAEAMHAQVLRDGTGTTTQIMAGMQWAIEENADVISMSLGGSAQGSFYSDMLVSAIRNANSQGTIVISSIGNSGEDTSSSPGNIYESIGVGAVDSQNSVADFSSGELVQKSDWDNPPADWPDEFIKPDVTAPGVNIKSATNSDTGYTTKSGTSMAAPHIAGVAALMQSATVDDTPVSDLRTGMETSAAKPDSWDESQDAMYELGNMDSRYGHGTVDALQAVDTVTEDPKLEISNTKFFSNTVPQTETVEVIADLENSGDLEKTFNVTVSNTNLGNVAGKNITLGPGEKRTAEVFTFSVDTPGTYTITIEDTTVGDLTIQEYATYDVSIDSVNQPNVGDDLTVDYTVSNSGDLSGEQDINFSVNGTVESTSENVTVAASGSTSDTFTYQTSESDGDTVDVAVSSTNNSATRNVPITQKSNLNVVRHNVTDNTEESNFDIEVVVEETDDIPTENLDSQLVVEDSMDSEVYTANSAPTQIQNNYTIVRFTDINLPAGTYESNVTFTADNADSVTTLDTFELVSGERFAATDIRYSPTPTRNDSTVDIEVDIENISGSDQSNTYIVVGLFDDENTEIKREEIQISSTVSSGQTVTKTMSVDLSAKQVNDLHYVYVNPDRDSGVSTKNKLVDVLGVGKLQIDSVDAPNEFIQGNKITFSADLQNTGRADLTQNIDYTIEDESGSEVYTDSIQDLTVNGSDTKSVTFNYTTSTTQSDNLTLKLTTANDTVSTVSQSLIRGELDITNFTSPMEAEQGEMITIEGDVKNTGDVELTNNISFKVDGVNETVTNNMTVAGRTTKSVSYEYTVPEDRDPSTDLTAAIESDTNSQNTAINILEVDDLTVEQFDTATEIIQGENLSVSATLVNDGEVDLEQDVVLSIKSSSQEIYSETKSNVTVAKSDQKSVSFNYPVKETQVDDLNVSIMTQDDTNSSVVDVLVDGELSVNNLVANNSVEQSDNITVTADVVNTGDIDKTQDIVFEVNNGDTNIITETDPDTKIAGGEVKQYSFNYTVESDQTEDLTVSIATDDSKLASDVEVLHGFEVDITDVDAPTPAYISDEIDITANIQNYDESDTQSIEFRANDSFVDESDITLDDGDATDVEFTYKPNDNGELNLSVESSDNYDYITIDIEREELQELSIELDDEVEIGSWTDITVTGEFANDVSEDVTDDATITTYDSDIISIDDGEIYGEEEGTATIRAEYTDEDDNTEWDEIDIEVVEEENDGQQSDQGTDETATPDLAESTSTVSQSTGTNTSYAILSETSLKSIEFGRDIGSEVVDVSEWNVVNEQDIPNGRDFVTRYDITVTDRSTDALPGTLTVTINKNNIANGYTANNLVGMKETDTGYRDLETTFVSETDDTATIEIETDDFSTFVVGLDTKYDNTEETDDTMDEVDKNLESVISIDSDNPKVGDDVTFSAAESVGDIAMYNWFINGESITGETVTVDFGSPGSYTVELTVLSENGNTHKTIQTVTVEEQQETQQPTIDDEEDETSGIIKQIRDIEISTYAYGLIAAIIALVIGLFVAKRRSI